MTGVAAVTRAQSPRFATATATLAAAELVLDKVPGIPNRTDAPAIAGRMIAGAFIGATIARVTGRRPFAFAAAGAVLAFASAQVSFRLRLALTRRLPPIAAALVEDALVVSIAGAGMARLANQDAIASER